MSADHDIVMSVIFWDINFAGKTWSRTSASVSVSNLVQIRSKMVELCRLTDFKMAAAAILVFGLCEPVWGTSFSAFVWSLAQMRAIMAELWPKMWFSIWQPAPSWILSDTSSQGKFVQWPYSRCLYQIWCESVQKWRIYGRLTDFKMAATAILNLITVSIFVIWSFLGSGCGCSCKIS